ncbi:Zinc transporter [Phytophthora pseudosyringae]|uniref:Zinc transporter n=1 Tax=Phytophthora pseudosyringae TaxID=221518 RepID=A0A8T1VMR8_9STRA|nr:Zinc transporter [Phytophthora pseudosyringae]
MSTEAAAMQAAATNQIDWLRKLLPHLRHKMADVARPIVNIAATHGYCDILVLVKAWWAPEDQEAENDKFSTGCGDSLMKAIEGAHYNVILELLATYYCDHSAGLELALRLGDGTSVAEILQGVDDMLGHLRWAACQFSSSCTKRAAQKVFLKPWALQPTKDTSRLSNSCSKNARGQVEIAKYLYARGAYVACSLDTVKSMAAVCGPLKLVKLFHDDGLYDESSLREAFEAAAGGEHLEIVEYLRAHGGCDNSSFGKAFVEAARSGKIETMKYLHALDGHSVSQISANEAFAAAACRGLLDAVMYLDSREHVSPDVIVGAFTSTATNTTCSTVRGRIDVMNFLYGKGCISSEKVSRAFVSTAYTNGVDVVKYLYVTVPHPPLVIDEAFQGAARQHCTAIVKFLEETGSVPPTAVDTFFLNAANYCRRYDVEFIITCGRISKPLMERALRLRHLSRSMDEFLRQYMKR